MLSQDYTQLEPRQSPFHRTIQTIMHSANWLIESHARVLKPQGLSEQQYHVLLILRQQQGKPVNLQAVQKHMPNPQSNVTRLIDKLLEKGFVERNTCIANRRKVELFITEQGLDILSKLEPMMHKVDAELFATLTEYEANLVGNLLDKLRS